MESAGRSGARLHEINCLLTRGVGGDGEQWQNHTAHQSCDRFVRANGDHLCWKEMMICMRDCASLASSPWSPQRARPCEAGSARPSFPTTLVAVTQSPGRRLTRLPSRSRRRRRRVNQSHQPWKARPRAQSSAQPADQTRAAPSGECASAMLQ